MAELILTDTLCAKQLRYIQDVLSELADHARVARALCEEGDYSDVKMEAVRVSVCQIGFVADEATKKFGWTQNTGGAEDWLLSSRLKESLKDLDIEEPI